MRKGREISSYSVSFISPLCSLLIFKLSRKWMKKALSTHATKHPWLMADLTQTRVDERYLANAGYRGRGRKCCKHWSTDSGIYGSRDCFIPTAPSLFVSVLCAKTTYNSQNNSTVFFFSYTTHQYIYSLSEFRFCYSDNSLWPKATWGREGFVRLILPGHSPSLKGCQPRSSSKNLMQKSWRKAACWFSRS